MASHSLRTASIRLAASLPDGAPLRRHLLASLREGAESDPVAKLQKLVEKHELGPSDMVDLASFYFDVPSLVGQPPGVVATAFKGWWGGDIPKHWDVGDKALGTMLEALVEVLPVLGPMAHKMSKGGTKTPKKASLMFMAVLATSAATANKGHASKAHKKEREARAQKRDSSYKPAPAGEPFKFTRVSQETGTTVEFEGDAHDYARWADDGAYDDYTWAKGKLGEKPASRDAWRGARMSFNVGDTPPTEGLTHVRAEVDARVALNVRAVLKKHGEDADVKKLVGEQVESQTKFAETRYTANRKTHLDGEFKGAEMRRFHEIMAEEEASAPGLEKFLKNLAPDWAAGKAEGRATTRHETEKADGKAPRSYDAYVKEKKERGTGRPMEKEEWEARFKGASR